MLYSSLPESYNILQYITFLLLIIVVLYQSLIRKIQFLHCCYSLHPKYTRMHTHTGHIDIHWWRDVRVMELPDSRCFKQLGVWWHLNSAQEVNSPASPDTSPHSILWSMLDLIRSVYCLFSCWLGPYSTGCTRGTGAVSSRLPAFCSGPVPASCCCHRPHPALRVETGSFWHQPRLWPIRLPTEEQRFHQVRRGRERDKTCVCLYKVYWVFTLQEFSASRF